MIDIDKLEQLAQSADTGPWLAVEDVWGDTHIKSELNGMVFELIDSENGDNVLFLEAANPATILQLCAEIRRLRNKKPRVCRDCIFYDGLMKFCRKVQVVTDAADTCDRWEALP